EAHRPPRRELDRSLRQRGVDHPERRPVSSIDPATNKVTATVEVGPQPGDPAVVGGDVWVPSVGGNSVAIVDPATATVRETLKVGKDPFAITAIAPFLLEHPHLPTQP